jgi:hypothetical protein
MEYSEGLKFQKDFKKLLRKYGTLKEDFDLMKRALLNPYFSQENPPPSKGLVKIEGFCGKIYSSYKIRDFACKALKGKGKQSGIRVVFVYQPGGQRISFVEIYYKGDQENEDKKRLQDFVKTLQPS